MYSGANRLLLEEVESDMGAPRRTSDADLAALRDFDQITVAGDFAVEVVQ